MPPWLELEAVTQPTLRALAGAAFLLAAAAGVWAAIRRQPLGARITTVAYGTAAIGLGLFVTNRPLPYLLAYVVALIGMNVLLYHSRAFGPVFAAVAGDDAVARRARGVVLRSLAISGGALALAYGGSLAVLPAFTLDWDVRDPITALLLAAATIVAVLFLAHLPTGLPLRRRLRAR